MREIKFRGKSVIDGKWVYGYFVKSKYHRSKPILYSYIHTPHQKEHNKPSTITMIETGTQCQFTGLKDKNGVEIYEGDTLAPYKAQVVWHDKLGAWCGQHTNDSDKWLLFTDLDNLEVIGNVHE